LTPLEIYTNLVAEIHYLQSIPQSEGGIRAGDDFYYAYEKGVDVPHAHEADGAQQHDELTRQSNVPVTCLEHQ
jgi:hypothetical protein